MDWTTVRYVVSGEQAANLLNDITGAELTAESLEAYDLHEIIRHTDQLKTLNKLHWQVIANAAERCWHFQNTHQWPPPLNITLIRQPCKPSYWLILISGCHEHSQRRVKYIEGVIKPELIPHAEVA